MYRKHRQSRVSTTAQKTATTAGIKTKVSNNTNKNAAASTIENSEKRPTDQKRTGGNKIRKSSHSHSHNKATKMAAREINSNNSKKTIGSTDLKLFVLICYLRPILRHSSVLEEIGGIVEDGHHS